MRAPVPSWNPRGVIDPANPIAPTAAARSPYAVSLREFAEAFATTSRRVEILKGLLSYRAELHAVGLSGGFQWLNGSFLEHVELLEHRDPNDMDVVTFYEMPAGHTQASLRAARPSLFPVNRAEQMTLKERFRTDAYLQVLNVSPTQLVGKSTYWYSMWAHRRDWTWKGFVEVDLRPVEDSETAVLLDRLAMIHAPGGPAIGTAEAEASVARPVAASGRVGST